MKRMVWTWRVNRRTAARRTILLALTFSLSPAPVAAAELIAGGWEISDETSSLTIDHNAWQQVLDGYLQTHPSGINRFDYGGLQASAADSAKLQNYLDALQAVDPRQYARAEQQPYWINFYNALTVRVVSDAFPVDSIRDVHRSPLPFPIGPWGDVHAKVAGTELTLDDIEHGILRPIWADARIHYAVNCASLGCPNLSPTAFTAANTETLLEMGARDYVNHPRGVGFVANDAMMLSSIYEWYVEDFGNSEKGVFEHLVRYATPELAARLGEFTGKITYRYDWTLNQPQSNN